MVYMTEDAATERSTSPEIPKPVFVDGQVIIHYPETGMRSTLSRWVLSDGTHFFEDLMQGHQGDSRRLVSYLEARKSVAMLTPQAVNEMRDAYNRNGKYSTKPNPYLDQEKYAKVFYEKYVPTPPTAR